MTDCLNSSEEDRLVDWLCEHPEVFELAERAAALRDGDGFA